MVFSLVWLTGQITCEKRAFTMKFRNPFKRSAAATSLLPVQQGPASYLTLIVNDDEAYAVFKRYLAREDSAENLEALAFLDRRCQDGEFSSPHQRHIFFNTYIASGSGKSINVSSKARPNLKNKVPGLSAELLGSLAYVGEMAMFLTPEVVKEIRRDLILTLCDSWGRFELTEEGRQLIARLDSMR